MDIVLYIGNYMVLCSHDRNCNYKYLLTITETAITSTFFPAMD